MPWRQRVVKPLRRPHRVEEKGEEMAVGSKQGDKGLRDEPSA